MSISPLTPSFGFGVTPGFGINPAYGVSATPPRTEVDLSTPTQGAQTFGQMLAQRVEAYGPAASMPALGTRAVNGVPGIDALGAARGVQTADGVARTAGTGFGQMVSDKLGQLAALHQRSDALATAAATGDLKDIHEYTIAANEASIATQLVTSVRDKALQAFNDIIRMQL